MFSRTRRVVVSTVVPVLAASGIAVAAQSNDQNQENNQNQSNSKNHHREFRGPGGPHHFLVGNARPDTLTYAEIHSRRDGKEVVTRTDRGKVKSVGSDSITITANDSSDVRVAVDNDTKILAGPEKGLDAKLSDIKEGKTVIVSREQGKAAEVIAVEPTGSAKRFRARMPHPPGGWEHGPGEDQAAGSSGGSDTSGVTSSRNGR